MLADSMMTVNDSSRITFGIVYKLCVYMCYLLAIAFIHA